MTSTIQTSYKNESGNFSFKVDKSYNIIVIDLNFGKHNKHKDLIINVIITSALWPM